MTLAGWQIFGGMSFSKAFDGVLVIHRGVGGKPKIAAKRDPSVSNSAWERIFQMNVDFHFTT